MNRTFYRMSWHTIGRAARAAWRVKADGVHHVPKEGPAILASNHLSYLDHYVMPCTIKRPVFFISKAQHFDKRFQAWFYEQHGVIPLRRGEGDNEAYARSLEVLQKGDLFCIYPEGTRSLDGKLHKGHTGVARLALEAGVPVVPVGMIGTFEALPKGQTMPRFTKCGVRFGPALDFSDHHGSHNDRSITRKVTDEIMMAIRDLTGQEYVDEYQKNPEYVRKDDATSA